VGGGRGCKGKLRFGGFPLVSLRVFGFEVVGLMSEQLSTKKTGILPIAKSNILDNDDSIAPEWVV